MSPDTRPPHDFFQRQAPTTSDEPSQADELPSHLLAKLRIAIPGYKLLSQISQGGQAIVFKAVSEKTTRTVAIKLLREGLLADETARERLKREVRVLATLNHPNIVGVIDSGQTPDGYEFLVMNYISGRSLDHFMHERASNPVLADSALNLRLFLKICDAVNAAHIRGITHRDLSPSNIMIDERGEPHVLDFGLARTAFDRFMAAKQRDISITGQFLGKLAYASPEQARGESDKIDIRTDVYALGVILYQILTGGSYPYKVVGSIADVLNNIIHTKPTPPSELFKAEDVVEAHKQRRLKKQHPPAVNASIEAIVLKALEKNPADRYQSAGELAKEIDQYLAGQPTTAPATAVEGLASLTGRRWQAAAALVLIACLAVSGVLIARRSDSPSIPTKQTVVMAPIDLLSLTQLPRDVRRGNWIQAAEGVASDETSGATLNLNADNMGEYDLQVAFTRKQGDGVVATTFFYGERRLLWYITLGSSGGTGIAISGANPGSNTWLSGSPQTSIAPLNNGNRYSATLRVRKDSIVGQLDGKTVISWQRKTGESELPGDWNVRASRLALMSQSPTQFHSARIVGADSN